MFCSDIPAPTFLVISDAIPSALLYYSHIPTAFIAVVMGFYIYFKGGKSLPSKILLFLTIIFSLWSFSNLIAWTNIDSRLIMFVWSFFPILYVALYLLSLYFTHVFIDEKDISNSLKLSLSGILVVLFGTYWTNLHLSGFDLPSCEAMEVDWFTTAYYSLSVGIFIWILIFGIKRFYTVTVIEKRKKILAFLVGMELFLGSFFMSSSVATYLDNFELEQYGLFGMVIFLGFLGYLIVRFKAFDIKMIGAQALVFGLIIIIGSQFFYASSVTDTVLDSVSFLLVIIAGFFLIRSVKREVERKEELEKLSRSLAIANDRLEELDKQKSEFISIASHQLRTPLTAIRGYISLALEGSYGKMDNPEITDLFHKIYTIDLRLSQLVEDLLNVSKIEAGKVQYKWDETSLEPVVRELYDMFIALAKKKGLSIAYEEPKTPLPIMTLDVNKIKEIISNLIDNAIKYTEKGGVTITIEATETVARVVIADTGIGISKEDAERLFGKFIRTETTKKMDSGGSGLGLFVGKTFVEAHGGRVYAESDGVGKGSRFIVELPFINPNKDL